MGVERMVTVRRRACPDVTQSETNRETAVTAAGGGNLGCGPQDLKEAEHNGDHHSTAAGPHESNVHQEKL